MIITKMGLSIQDKGEIILGAPLVELGDHLFWFNSPKFLLFLMQLLLFQNAFELAFFSWSTYEFSIKSCFNKTRADPVIRLILGVGIQFLCSYVTLPLYALVIQMGSTTMSHNIFNEGSATATAKKRVKHNKHSNNDAPFSSRPSTPTHGMSPVHLLHRHTAGNSDSLQTSPRTSNYENIRLDAEGGLTSSRNNQTGAHEIQMPVVESFSTTELPERQVGRS
ncbi:MLO-like protein 6-like [Trifolium pratense]|uniref:MLO-like protein 6-like n=2 Tax=Trifolium pratense TaxID=57577 RepID=A0A2K3PEG2_TRIPR|nr:MLO-like protein 6-like [Trifolium pratense]